MASSSCATSRSAPPTKPLERSRRQAGGSMDKLARAVTEVLAPANLAVSQLLLVGWHSAPGAAGLGWGLFAATMCGVIPYGIVVAGVRRRRWTDRHLRDRTQRPIPLLAAVVLIATGLAMLVVLNGPPQLVALVAAMLTALTAALVVTLWWKLSVHAAAAGGTVAILTLTLGPALTLSIPVVALVAWSRVRLGDHTTAQTVAGAAVGGLIATIVFVVVR